jgi:hypothetical protein
MRSGQSALFAAVQQSFGGTLRKMFKSRLHVTNAPRDEWNASSEPPIQILVKRPTVAAFVANLR